MNELMNGIEILSKEICGASIVSGIILMAVGSSLLILWFEMIKMKHKTHCETIFAIIILFISASIIFSSVLIIKNAPTQYKVIVSDEVSMNEFSNSYKIIQQDGKIYTIIERSKQ